MSHANNTVKKGADDLIVSVNETGTKFRDTSPSITVEKRITPTNSMSRRNVGLEVVDLAELAGAEAVKRWPHHWRRICAITRPPYTCNNQTG